MPGAPAHAHACCCIHRPIFSAVSVWLRGGQYSKYHPPPAWRRPAQAAAPRPRGGCAQRISTNPDRPLARSHHTPPGACFVGAPTEHAPRHVVLPGRMAGANPRAGAAKRPRRISEAGEKSEAAAATAAGAPSNLPYGAKVYIFSNFWVGR